MKNKKFFTDYAWYCSTTMLTSEIIKETMYFNSILISHKITYGTVMIKTPLSSFSLF